jgi:two-component system response regulator FlrC
MNKAMAGTQQGDDTSGAATRERILIVEDSKGIRELMVDILTIAGYECRAVSSGREALARLNSGERFDLMLCDLLNNPHGINLLDRTQQNCPSMPVIISTAPCCLCTARFAVKNMGASGILLKPFRPKALLTSVWGTLAGRSISRATSAIA